MTKCVSVAALCKLFATEDPRLGEIQLKGDLIISHDQKIRTRSQTKTQPDRYTVISLPLKIIKMLLKELISSPQSDNGAVVEGEAEGDEWEDVTDIGSLSNADCTCLEAFTG